jgi:anaerobic selenocysteine-containing dehydrogenase
VPRQQQRAGAPSLLIHPADALPLGISSGDQVRVCNSRGAFLAFAEVSDRIRPGIVASSKGRWLRFSEEGTTVNSTVAERDADMGGGATYHDNRVRVDRPL